MCFTNKCKYELSDGRCQLLRQTIPIHMFKTFSEFKIEKGEIICPKCNGRGLFTFKREVVGSVGGCLTLFHTCTKCKSLGKIDWVDNLTAKEEYYVTTGKIPRDSYCSTNDYKYKN